MDVPSLVCRTGWTCAALVALAGFAVPVRADSLDQITVQAQRDREKLKHDVNDFVSSVLVKPREESLMRWGPSAVSAGCGIGARAGGVRSTQTLGHRAIDSRAAWQGDLQTQLYCHRRAKPKYVPEVAVAPKTAPL